MRENWRMGEDKVFWTEEKTIIEGTLLGGGEVSREAGAVRHLGAGVGILREKRHTLFCF